MPYNLTDYNPIDEEVLVDLVNDLKSKGLVEDVDSVYIGPAEELGKELKNGPMDPEMFATYTAHNTAHLLYMTEHPEADFYDFGDRMNNVYRRFLARYIGGNFESEGMCSADGFIDDIVITNPKYFPFNLQLPGGQIIRLHGVFLEETNSEDDIRISPKDDHLEVDFSNSEVKVSDKLQRETTEILNSKRIKWVNARE